VKVKSSLSTVTLDSNGAGVDGRSLMMYTGPVRAWWWISDLELSGETLVGIGTRGDGRSVIV